MWFTYCEVLGAVVVFVVCHLWQTCCCCCCCYWRSCYRQVFQAVWAASASLKVLVLLAVQWVVVGVPQSLVGAVVGPLVLVDCDVRGWWRLGVLCVSLVGSVGHKWIPGTTPLVPSSSSSSSNRSSHDRLIGPLPAKCLPEAFHTAFIQNIQRMGEDRIGWRRRLGTTINIDRKSVV